MKRASLGLALGVVFLVGVSAVEGDEVLASPEGVVIRTDATPVSDVLDALAKQAGVKIIYDGAPPRDPVTVDRRSHSLVEAIPALLEGLGLSYVLKMDDTGTKVDTLFVAGGTTPGSTATASLSGPSDRAERMRQLLERRRAQMQEQGPPADDPVGEPSVPGEPEGPPADSFTEAVAAAQDTAEGEAEANQSEPVTPPAQFAPSSPFTPSPFAPPPPPPQPNPNP
jgi:hypothetical protein